VPGRRAAGVPASSEALIKALRAQGVRDRRVIAAFRAVPRAGFVPAEAARVAYVDELIAIPDGEVTTQPSLIARMVAALSLSGTEQVLEVGTGLGFQTAILAVLARDVVSVERFADLAGRRAPTSAQRGWPMSPSWSATAPWACLSMPRTTRSRPRPHPGASPDR
jgi:protein-L-isoaspartate(D-aspartate) O-methyltransferase